MPSLRKSLVDTLHRAVDWGDRRVPPGVRSIVGVLFMAGGMLGFLPILGLWMLPVGAAFVALDVSPLRRRLLDWLDRQRGVRQQPLADADRRDRACR